MMLKNLTVIMKQMVKDLADRIWSEFVVFVFCHAFHILTSLSELPTYFFLTGYVHP